MRRRMIAVSMLAISPWAAMEVQAQEESGVSVSGNVSFTTDYAFRGISQTLRESAIQGGLDADLGSGLYVGVWGSSLNFGEDLAGGARAQMEFDMYAGFAPEWQGFSFDLGGIYYAYPGSGAVRNYEFLEFTGGVSRDVLGVTLGTAINYSPEFFAGSGSAVHWSGDLSTSLPAGLSLGLSGGFQTIEDNAAFGTDDYAWGQVALGAEVLGLGLSAAFVSTSLSESECFSGTDFCAPRVLFSVSK